MTLGRMIEQERQMPYVTSVERNAEQRGVEIGWKEGREIGREEGRASLLLQILTQVCGDLPAEIQSEICQLTNVERQQLIASLLDIRKVADLSNWLRTNGRSSPNVGTSIEWPGCMGSVLVVVTTSGTLKKHGNPMGVDQHTSR
jgi:hypothetical protein